MKSTATRLAMHALGVLIRVVRRFVRVRYHLCMRSLSKAEKHRHACITGAQPGHVKADTWCRRGDEDCLP